MRTFSPPPQKEEKKKGMVGRYGGLRLGEGGLEFLPPPPPEETETRR